MASGPRAPFPWFGGKRRVADVVWRAFGADVPNYVEPFAGSLAVLLGRPGGAGKIETCNDADRYLANFFRAVTAEPDEVARWADWPVNEADLHARHQWLVNQAEFRERMHSDPDFYDVKIAGWWVWGLCQWIGGGWCMEPQNHKGVHSAAGHTSWRERPHMSGTSSGMGVHAKRPAMAGTSEGRGVHAKRGRSHDLERKRPKMADQGSGVHSDAARLSQQIPNLRVTDGAAGAGIHASGLHPPRQLPDMKVANAPGKGTTTGHGVHASGLLSSAYSPGRRPTLGSEGQGVHLPSLGNDRGLNGVAAAPCVEWFRELQQRLRRVRVACGDWKRVLGPSVLGKGKNVGGRRPCAVFLDPPYSHEFRDPYLYLEDDSAVAVQVREWALEHGDDPDLRICLAGYWDEHQALMPASWTSYRWKGARGYAGDSNTNREQETLWFSPHCLPLEVAQGSLFAGRGSAAP